MKVVYSKELPLKPTPDMVSECAEEGVQKRSLPGSNAFTPSVAGLIIASEVVKDLVDYHPQYE